MNRLLLHGCAPSVLVRLVARSISSSSATTFLHVGPAGDCWTGDSIFAAKHLQPDYVRSVPLPPSIDTEALLAALEDNPQLGQQVYDDQRIPEALLEQIRQQPKEL